MLLPPAMLVEDEIEQPASGKLPPMCGPRQKELCGGSDEPSEQTTAILLGGIGGKQNVQIPLWFRVNLTRQLT